MAAASTNGFKVIGTRPIRHDGVDKVTGRAKYGADYSFPGMLHGKVLRSPHAHANIKSIKHRKGAAPCRASRRLSPRPTGRSSPTRSSKAARGRSTWPISR